MTRAASLDVRYLEVGSNVVRIPQNARNDAMISTGTEYRMRRRMYVSTAASPSSDDPPADSLTSIATSRAEGPDRCRPGPSTTHSFQLRALAVHAPLVDVPEHPSNRVVPIGPTTFLLQITMSGKRVERRGSTWFSAMMSSACLAAAIWVGGVEAVVDGLELRCRCRLDAHPVPVVARSSRSPPSGCSSCRRCCTRPASSDVSWLANSDSW